MGRWGLPKWTPHSRLGTYIGHSPACAVSVALLLIARTELVPFSVPDSVPILKMKDKSILDFKIKL